MSNIISDSSILDSLINKVNEKHEVVVITNKKGEDAVLISLSDFDSIKETLYLLSNEANAKHIFESIRQEKEGKFNLFTIEQLEDMIK